MIEPIPAGVHRGGRYDHMSLDNQRGSGAVAEDAFSAFSPKVSDVPAPRRRSRLPSVGQRLRRTAGLLPPRAEQPHAYQRRGQAAARGHLQQRNRVEGERVNGRVSFEATYFHMVEDGVVLSQRQGPFFFPTNAGELRYDGVETGLSVDITPKVSAYVNASFYHSRFGEFVIEKGEPVSLLLLLAGMSVLPFLLVTFTSFTKISVVLSLTRSALGTQQRRRSQQGRTLTIDRTRWSTRRSPGGTARCGDAPARNLFNEEHY
jgi:hypothetical protein